MEEIGLSNVTMEETRVDGHIFKGANVTFTNVNGEEQKIDLGSYQCTIKADNETVPLVYLGQGTTEDYVGADVTGKLVLIDIDQNEDWWISSPAVQAMLHGAKGVLANSCMYVEDGDRIGTQDICAPAEAVALGISDNNAQALKDAIAASENGEIEVVFNADAEVIPDTASHNVWGEIPGKTDEVIYMMAHMDGYFHSYFDDASGDGLIMGIAKAMMDSGYSPNKTIRFVFHGAEEFGRSNSEADWAIGAYEMINTLHPEWADNAYAIVNIDGAYCVEGETTFGVAVGEELAEFAAAIADPLIAESGYTYRYQTPQSTYKEDFNYTAHGIPSVGTAKGVETLFYDYGYHTSCDAREKAGFDENTWLWMHTLYGAFVYEFDRTPVRVMDFGARFEAFKESLDTELITDEALYNLVDEVIAAAAPITEAQKQINADYAAASEAGDTAKMEELQAQAVEMNKKTHVIYKAVNDALLWLDGDFGVVFPNEVRQDNINNLMAAIDCLKEGDPATASDEYLSCIGNAWYAMFFDEETIAYREGCYEEGLKDTWADGRIDTDFHPEVYAVNNKCMNAEGTEDFTADIEVLETVLADQIERLGTCVEREKTLIQTVLDLMK